MTKACLQKDLQNLGNEIEDLIMLEDSARGTLCAIHKTIHSTDNFPCSKHKMLRLCPAPRGYNLLNTRIPISRSRRKTRSNSPCYDRTKMCRTLSANEPCYRPCCAMSHNNYCRCEGCKVVGPGYHSSNYANVEKTISCPEKMCCHTSASNKTCTVTSRSSVQVDKQFAQNLMNTDEVVSELKDEIEKVKHQLHHISQQKLIEKNKPSSSLKVTPPKTDEQSELLLNKLKNDNKRFKREIEAKRKLLDKSRGDVEKAKEILSDYEKKVGLLHVQALKSSKAMKLSKEKFCTCLKDREEKMKILKESNNILVTTIKEKDSALDEKEKEISKLNERIEKLKTAFEETCEKCTVLKESNQNFYESIELLRDQLERSSTEIETYKENIKKMEQKLSELNCTCKKVTNKTKKQKEVFENEIKSYHEEKSKMTKIISDLTAKLAEAGQHKISLKKLESQCQELQEKVKEYENFSEKCKGLEEECEELYDKLVSSEQSFQNDREEMHKLIDELTTVVKVNKVTILQMSDVNKQQESIIKTQSMALMTKEEQLKLIEKESEDFKIRNIELTKEVQELKQNLSRPCSREACKSISKELEEIRNALIVEKDTQLLKEKIIEDQSQTIINLQSQVKEKMIELNKAQSDTMYLEDEISKINDKLIKKHRELDEEVDEKESLIEKLRILECQKNQLTEELGDFEEMLQGFKKTYGDNEKQQKILKRLENQIREQREQWEVQKEAMTKEKQKAVCAATFATQKLLDTVADFQRQVDAQKKVQLLLTKMLHEKDEQLRIVTSKISSINNITNSIASPGDKDISMKQLFFRDNMENIISSDMNTNTNTNTSMYSSCSSCCKKSDCLRHARTTKSEKSCSGKGDRACLASCADTNNVLKLLNSNILKIQEEPSRDFS